MSLIYKKILANQKKKKPLLAVLIDPDKFNKDLVVLANKSNVFCFFVGGSKLHDGKIDVVIKEIKRLSKLPIVIFPGDFDQMHKSASAGLIPVLVSGRNPDYLIGKHVEWAKKIKSLNIETIPTAYLLVNGQRVSTTQTVTKTNPLNEINEIVSTAIASEMIGLKLLYLEAGSGAANKVNSKIITSVKRNISLPIIVGGGIDSLTKVKEVIKSGADVVVIGNALEKNLSLLEDIKNCFK